MKILLLFLILSLSIGCNLLPFGTQDSDEGTGEAPQDLDFNKRFDLYLPSEDGKKPVEEVTLAAAPGSACAPESKVHTFGFVSGGQNDVPLDLTRRVQYYSVHPGKFGNLELSEHKKTEKGKGNKLRQFTKKVHQYDGLADLVIRKEGFLSDVDADGEGLVLGKSFVLLNLVDEIVDEVEDNNFDGVTIDFQGFESIPENQDPILIRESFKLFIKRLDNRLQRQAKGNNRNKLLFVKGSLTPPESQIGPLPPDLSSGRRVNVVLPVLPVSGSNAVLAVSGSNVDFLVDLNDSVNAFLGDPAIIEKLRKEMRERNALLQEIEQLQDPENQEQTAQIQDRIAQLRSQLNSQSSQGMSQVPIKDVERKLVPIFAPDEKLLDHLTTPGGVGIWTLGQIGSGKEDDHPAPASVGELSKATGKNGPERLIGPYVCPNRVIIRWVVGALAAAGVIYLLLSTFIYDLRRFMRRRLLYFLAALLVMVVLFIALIIADPLIEGWEIPALLALVLVGAGYAAWQFWNNKNRATYP